MILVVSSTKNTAADIYLLSKLSILNLALYGIAGVSVFIVNVTKWTKFPDAKATGEIVFIYVLFKNVNDELLETKRSLTLTGIFVESVAVLWKIALTYLSLL